MNHKSMPITKYVLIIVTVLFIATVIILYSIQNARKSQRAEHHIGLNSVKERSNFTIFVPTYLSNLEISHDWQTNERKDYAYFSVSVEYKTKETSNNELAIVSIEQRRIQNGDKDFLKTERAEDDNFIYEEVLIGTIKGLLMTAKYDLPYKKTAYDPRLATRLVLVKNNTYIVLQTRNKNIFPVDELIKVAASLAPLP